MFSRTAMQPTGFPQIRDLNGQHMGGLSPRGSERAHLNGPENPTPPHLPRPGSFCLSFSLALSRFLSFALFLSLARSLTPPPTHAGPGNPAGQLQLGEALSKVQSIPHVASRLIRPTVGPWVLPRAS